jgi:large subunit ribosomal protein L31
MREGLHPRYKPVVITCVGCGTKIETRSTKGRDFSIDVCSHCHPFYTGRQKFVDSAGRVERFQKKWAAKETAAKNVADKKAAKEAAATEAAVSK